MAVLRGGVITGGITGGGGSGTVTSVSALLNGGLATTPNPITSSGTVRLNYDNLTSLVGSLDPTDIISLKRGATHYSSTIQNILDLISGTEPANVYYVASNGSDATGDGKESNPWLTVQNAVDNVPDNSLILVAPDLGVYYAGDVTITDRIGIRIATFSAIEGRSQVQLGDLIINGASQNISISDMQVGGAMTFEDTLGGHVLQRMDITNNMNVTGTFTGNLTIDNCSIVSDLLLNGTPSSASIIIKNMFIGDMLSPLIMYLTIDSSYFVIINGAQIIGRPVHNAGTFIINNVQNIVPIGLDAILSTAMAIGGSVLAVANAGLINPGDGAYYRINKTGDCPWVIAVTNRNPAIDILTGPRYIYGQPSIDISWDNSGSYIIADNVQDAIQELYDLIVSPSIQIDTAVINQTIFVLPSANNVIDVFVNGQRETESFSFLPPNATFNPVLAGYIMPPSAKVVFHYN